MMQIKPIAAIALVLLGSVALPGHAIKQAAPPVDKPLRQSVPPIRPRTVCPPEFEPLITGMLRDLPSYINRLSHQRGGSLETRYAIAIGIPDFTPITSTLKNLEPPTVELQSSGLHQVFFTVLERQYDTTRKTEYQNHHWLFLAHSPQVGWQLAMLYSRLDDYPTRQSVASPLRETSQEVIGRAIRLWLRDCQSGAVAPIASLR